MILFVDEARMGWYVSDGYDAYLRDDMTTHPHMQGAGGTYFETREEAQAAADRFNGATDDTPKTWGEMTAAEKGALLLAHRNGKDIEWRADGVSKGKWLNCPKAVGKYDDYAYRVKPDDAPMVEAVEVTGLDLGRNAWGFGDRDFTDTHRITFEVVDGEVDCSSVKMEEL